MTMKVCALVATLSLGACSGLGGPASPPSGSAPESPDPAWTSAPDEGRSVPQGDRWGIYRLEIQAETVELIYSSPARVSYLRLNSAGDRFVFSGTVDDDANEQEEIFSIGTDGRDLRRLTDNAYWDLYPVWSPDGARIAFLSWRSDGLGIFRMPSDGGDPEELLDTPAHEADIDWVNDVIAFTRDGRIWTMRPDGSAARRLTDPPRAGEWGAANLPFGDYDPRISPDGSRLVFERLLGDESRHGNYDIFVADLATAQETRLTATGFSQGLPSWSHSGRQLAYIVSAINNVGKYDIYLMDADGANSRSITPDYFPPQFLCHWAVFSADDQSVYFIGEWWS